MQLSRNWLVALAVAVVVVAPLLVAESYRPQASTPESLYERFMTEHDLSKEVPPPVYVPPQVDMTYKVTSFAGVETPFPIRVIETTSPVVFYTFDFESDGVLDWQSQLADVAVHTYLVPGEYLATFYVYDIYGEAAVHKIPVVVNSGSGRPTYAPNEFKLSFNYHDARKLRSATAATDTAKNYFLLVGGGTYQWQSVHDAYEALVDSFGYDADDIILIAGKQGGGAGRFTCCTPDQQDTVWIDHERSANGLDSAFNELLASMTSIDNLHMLDVNHGSGFTTDDAATYGDTGGYWSIIPYANLYYGHLVTAANDPELDQIESEFKILEMCDRGLRQNPHGMYEWCGSWLYGTNISRRRRVTTFPATKFRNLGPMPVSDTDIYVEQIAQHFRGDTDYDWFLDPGEVLDWDNDGHPAIDTSGSAYIYDEGDWGALELVANTNHGGTAWPNVPLWFDDDKDSTLDMDFDCDDLENPVVDGTDSDNDGYIIGIDFNGDGDKLDSVGVNESSGGLGLDDIVASFVDSLSYAHVTLMNQTCYGGGFIDDLSRDDVLIATATTAGTVSWNTTFVDHMWGFLTGKNTSVGTDYIVNFQDAFDSLPLESGNFDGRERLDDNGDQVGHVFTLPNGGDGYLADSLCLGTLSPPAPRPYALNPSNYDTLIDDLTPTFTWSDSGSCDSFAIRIWDDGVLRITTHLLDTFFTIPDSMYLSVMPSTSPSYSHYDWAVKSYRRTSVSPEKSATFHIVPNDTCCNGDGIRGDVNLNDDITLGDLTMLSDFLTGSHSPLPCWTEANVDGSENEVPNSTDLDFLLNYLFLTGDPPPDSCDN